MIDLTLSSDDEAPRKRQRVSPERPENGPQQHNSTQQFPPQQPHGQDRAAATGQPAQCVAGPATDLQIKREWRDHEPGPSTAAPALLNPFPDPIPLPDPDDEDYDPSHDGEDEHDHNIPEDEDDLPPWERDLLGKQGRGAGGGRGTGAGARGSAGGGGGVGGGSDSDEEWEGGGGGRGRRKGGRAAADAAGSQGGAEAAGAAKKRGGGGGKRLTAEEREEREAAKLADKAAREAERVRLREEKAAAKAAEKAAKAAEKEELKRSKAAQKDATKSAKEAGNSLKASMVPRHMRLLLSNSLAASPLGARIVELAPAARAGGAKDQNFPTEVHRDMPLAARGYRYCMWGVRLPAAAAARLAAAEGAALEASQLGDPDGTGLPLLLFPAVLLVLGGEELLQRLDAEPAAPLGSLVGQVRGAHPAASLLVYVVGLEEAVRRRERGNKSFSRAAVEDLLFDVVIGMPAVRIQFDCPDSQLDRAAIEILNLGWALSQQPRKRTEAYLETFGSRSTVPLRAVKEVLAASGGPETLACCDALSCLVAPQRAAAVAAQLPSLAALLEALGSREDETRNAMARYRIPGVAPGKYKQQYAGPAAAASISRFLKITNGREEWKDGDDVK